MQVVVQEWQRLVVLRDGRVTRVLAAGRHRVHRRRETTIPLDVRPAQFTVAAQEIPAADGVPVRVSLAVRWQITDPARYVSQAQRPADELYLALQLALRTIVGRVAHTDVTAAVNDAVVGAVGEVSAELGVEVTAAQVKDVVLPVELRRAATELIAVRERGRRELERARGEAAALRSLANTARLLEEHPALLDLRAVQAAEGGTVVLAARGGLVAH